MSTKHTYKPTGPFAPQYIQGVYAPSAVLIVGAALVNKSLVPVAIAIAAALAGYQFFNNRECLFSGSPPPEKLLTTRHRGQEGP